jgi:probable HAF family extracellular repeat protein
LTLARSVEIPVRGTASTIRAWWLGSLTPTAEKRSRHFRGAGAATWWIWARSAAGPSQATGVNANGQVVGWSYTANSEEHHAWSWTPKGGILDLGTFGGAYSFPAAIAASGQVVGFGYTANNLTHAFSWIPAKAER